MPVDINSAVSILGGLLPRLILPPTFSQCAQATLLYASKASLHFGSPRSTMASESNDPERDSDTLNGDPSFTSSRWSHPHPSLSCGRLSCTPENPWGIMDPSDLEVWDFAGVHSWRSLEPDTKADYTCFFKAIHVPDNLDGTTGCFAADICVEVMRKAQIVMSESLPSVDWCVKENHIRLAAETMKIDLTNIRPDWLSLEPFEHFTSEMTRRCRSDPLCLGIKTAGLKLLYCIYQSFKIGKLLVTIMNHPAGYEVKQIGQLIQIHAPMEGEPVTSRAKINSTEKKEFIPTKLEDFFVTEFSYSSPSGMRIHFFYRNFPFDKADFSDKEDEDSDYENEDHDNEDNASDIDEDDSTMGKASVDADDSSVKMIDLTRDSTSDDDSSVEDSPVI